MGGTESSVDNYVRQNGIQALLSLILLKKQILWLEESCVRQVNRKIEDEIKHILFQMDQFVNEKKQMALSQYKKIKSEILQKQFSRVKNCQQKHGKSLQNIYGKNNFLDKLNLLKINFHIQIHITKKRVRKIIEQKISSIQNDIFIRQRDDTISKQQIQMLFKDSKRASKLSIQKSEIQMKFEEFKKQVIEQLNFNTLFWPHFDYQIRQTQQQVIKIYNEVQKNTKNMKKDLQGNWNIFKFQST